MKNSGAKSLIGCCGLYCGLCNKYQSKAPSRCIGCKSGEQHLWCSIWNCCVKKRGFETCAECSEVFNCEIFLRRKVAQWISAADNLRRIKEVGLENRLKEQKERQALVEELLGNYNEGRSMSFFCKACARMPIELINKAIKETKKELLSETVGVTECYKKKGVDFCFQCDEFPCEKTNFDPHLKARWIKMNNRMKEIGVESYYEETKDLCRYL